METATFTHDLAKDRQTAADLFARLRADLDRLPRKPERSPGQQERAEELLTAGRAAREQFMALHAPAVYDEVSDGYTRLDRAGELVYRAAELFPGLTPTRAEIATELEVRQKDKDGWEIDQGIFLAHVLDQPRPAYHLMHAMTQPLPQALTRVAELRARGRVDLGPMLVEKRGDHGVVTIQNHQYLNAEDNASSLAMEIAVDLLLLDEDVQVGVLRGGHATNTKYAGRRVFDAGLNLTHLWHGRIAFAEFLIERELGLLNKVFRGHSTGSGQVTLLEERHEMPWVAAVEAFAIGGGCQNILVMDRVLAQRGAYFNLPARREGFIPGLGNLRLPRFVGERVARQGVFFDHDIQADTPEGRLVADVVVDDEEQLDTAILESVDLLTTAGQVGVLANRKAMRVGAEPLEALRGYMANYARAQASCMYSPGIIANLEKFWQPETRTLH